MAKNKFFVVWDGKEPGIYTSWEECKRQVSGYAGAKFKGFATEAEAREAMLSPCWDYIGKNAVAKRPGLHKLPADRRPVFPSIAVDAACSGNPGDMEYRGVNAQTGEEIFRRGPFPEGTNNIGEFLALVHGLALLKQQNSKLPIYSDSRTAQAWLRKKKAATKLQPTERNRILFDLVARAEKWLQENTYENPVLKWQTELWGEIPADFGRK